MQPSHISSGFDTVNYLQACPGRSWHFPVENMLSSLACHAELSVAHFSGGIEDSMTPAIREGVLEKFQDTRHSFSLF